MSRARSKSLTRTSAHLRCLGAGLFVAGIALSILATPTEGRHRRGRHRGRHAGRHRVRLRGAYAPRPRGGSSNALRGIGAPKLLVTYRAGIAAYGKAAQVLKRLSPFAVESVTLGTDEALVDLRADLRDRRASMIVAFGALAEQVCASGVGNRPVVFGYGAGPPKTSVAEGGWIRMEPPPRTLVRWARRILPKLRTLGVILPSTEHPLRSRLSRAAQRLGVRIRFASVATAGGGLSAALQLLRAPVDLLWLGPDYRPWTAARLRALRRLQFLFRTPVIGLSAAQVRRGLAVAIDASPAAVAEAVVTLLRKHVRAWVPARRRGRGVQGSRRAARGRPDTLSVGAPRTWRVAIGERALRCFDLQAANLLKAGAVRITP